MPRGIIVPLESPLLRYTSERLDPLLNPKDAAFDQATLALHLTRYRLAAEYVREADT